MQHNKIILVTTDNHTLGIQTVASIICRETNILPVMFYLPSNLPEYPFQIEEIPNPIDEVQMPKERAFINNELVNSLIDWQ